MQRLCAPIALSIALLTPGVGDATEDIASVWAIFSASGRIGEETAASRWRYWFDAQQRYIDIGSGANTWLLRPAAGYMFGDDVIVWAGYGRFESRSRTGASVHEDRLWQQLNWTAARWQHGSLQMRLRLEQRSVSIGRETAFVLRYQLGVLNAIDRAARYHVSVLIEPFFNLRDTAWSGPSRMSQVRSFIGLRVLINDAWSIEAGYRNQLSLNRGIEDVSNHVAVVNLRLRP